MRFTLGTEKGLFLLWRVGGVDPAPPVPPTARSGSPASVDLSRSKLSVLTVSVSVSKLTVLTVSRFDRFPFCRLPF